LLTEASAFAAGRRGQLADGAGRASTGRRRRRRAEARRRFRLVVVVVALFVLVVGGLGLTSGRLRAGRLRLSRGRRRDRCRGRGPCRDLGEADAGGRGEREPDNRSDNGAPAESADSFFHGGIPSVRGWLTSLSR